jgi:hypothetical protein
MSDAQQELIRSLGSSDGPLVEALLDELRSNSLSPSSMAFIYEKYPGLRRKLLLDWFFAQKQDPHQMGNSIEYFLTILLRNRDHGLMKDILLDLRMAGLPISILLDLGQKLDGYRYPRSLRESFPHLAEFNGYLLPNSTHQLSDKAVPELVQFMRAAAEFVDAKHTN